MIQEEEPENEEEEEAANEEIEREMGPPLLSPCSEDASLETIAPWTVRITSTLVPDKAFASIRSNLWPGAYNYTVDKYKLFIGNDLNFLYR